MRCEPFCEEEHADSHCDLCKAGGLPLPRPAPHPFHCDTLHASPTATISTSSSSSTHCHHRHLLLRCQCKACAYCPKRHDTGVACSHPSPEEVEEGAATAEGGGAAQTSRCEPFCALAYAESHCRMCKRGRRDRRTTDRAPAPARTQARPDGTEGLSVVPRMPASGVRLALSLLAPLGAVPLSL